MPTIKKKAKELSDEEIVRQILATGNSTLFEEIYDRYALKVYRKSLSFTKNESEAKDVAHDIMVKLYLSLSKFQERSKFSTWLYSVTYNHCVDYQSKKTKQNTLQEELKKYQESFTGTEPLDSELLEISIDVLYELLNKISLSEKTILLMKYQDGLSIKEIAAITEAGESAVKMKLKRSKEKLMKFYEQRGK